MNKDVKIRIVGTHGEGKNKSAVVTNCSGLYYQKNGKTYLKYTEKDDETGATRNALVVISGKTVSVEYRGNTDTVMLFEVGKTNNSMYITPLGSMRLTITTKHMEIDESENKLYILLEYTMSFDEDSDGDFASIQIEVTNA